MSVKGQWLMECTESKNLAFYCIIHVTCHTLSKNSAVVILLPDNTTISYIPQRLLNIVRPLKQLGSAQVIATRVYGSHFRKIKILKRQKPTFNYLTESKFMRDVDMQAALGQHL